MSGSSISEPTKEGYDLCKQYVDKCTSIGPDVVWNPALTPYESDVLAGKHNDLPFIFIENEEPNWPKFILCEAYIQAYETKLELQRQQQERWENAVKKRNAGQSSGGRRSSKKRSTARPHPRRRSSKSRKSRNTRRR